MVKKYSHGFTLTELIIVISIIAFLVLLGIVYFRSQVFKANDARRKADLKRIQVAVEEYEKDHDCYPTPDLVTCEPGDSLKPYIDKIPCDPTTGESYFYDYDVEACPSWYRVFAHLDNENDSDISGTGGSGSGSGSGGDDYNYCSGSPNAPSCALVETGNFYGCVAGNCVPIYYDQTRPGPECDPNYQSPTCYGQCVSQSTECKPWNQ